jgi:hypothetical protein
MNILDKPAKRVGAVRSYTKNIIICLLAAVVGVLAIRLWFGPLSFAGFFSDAVPIAARTAINPWQEAAAPLMIRSARLTIGLTVGVETGPDLLHYREIYNNLEEQEGWRLAEKAIRQLIERGSFARSGSLDEDFLLNQFGRGSLVIGYNFLMPSNFFREFFSTRPGFLSSHFAEFDTLIISSSLDFSFANSQTRNFYVFSLDSPALYAEFAEFFAAELAANVPEVPSFDVMLPDVMRPDLMADFMPDLGFITPGNIAVRNPIGMMLLDTVEEYVSFFFPAPSAVTSGAINMVYTYRDLDRVVRFFPDSVVEFNAVPRISAVTRAGGTEADFVQSLLAAFDMISRDARNQRGLGAPMNEVILASHHYAAETGHWHFYFDYITADTPVDLARIMPEHRGHALEVRVLGGSVVFYRRLMLNFYEVSL